MNIFFTSPCPKKCAQYLDDKRVVKMCLETAQMLSTAIVYHYEPKYFENNSKENKASRNELATNLGLYKPTHANHPSNVWCRSTKTNYSWLFNHFIFLLAEYTNRYGKIHASQSLLMSLANNFGCIPDGGLTPFVNCAANKELNLDFKQLPVHEAYKKYLTERFKTDKRKPTWYKK